MTLITTNSELQSFCNSLSNVPFITVDTEFLREKTYYAKLCLIQISGPDKDARAIDVLSEEEVLDLTPVWDLMNNKNILKVFHAARQDLEIIYNLSGKFRHRFTTHRSQPWYADMANKRDTKLWLQAFVRSRLTNPVSSQIGHIAR